MQKAVLELMETCEAADEVCSSADRAVKYRKDKEGHRVTPAYIGACQSEIAEFLNNLSADIRQAKCHFPKFQRVDDPQA